MISWRGRRDGYTTPDYTFDQNIIVQGRSSDTRLGVFRYNHNDIVNFNGDIDLSNYTTNGWPGNELRLYVEDELRRPDGGRAPSTARTCT